MKIIDCSKGTFEEFNGRKYIYLSTDWCEFSEQTYHTFMIIVESESVEVDIPDHNDYGFVSMKELDKLADEKLKD